MSGMDDRVTNWRMSQVKTRNTKPEVTLRRMLHSFGFRYRLHVADLPGKPDIVLPKYKTIIFVHGCFWHRHAGCKRASMPVTNVEFWKTKFEKNVSNELKAQAVLRKNGWKVFVVWECELSKSRIVETSKRLQRQVRGE